MKIYLVITTIVAPYCSSCNKELNNSGIDSNSFYIKATLNGQVRTFSDNSSAAEYSGHPAAEYNMRADDNISAAEFTYASIWRYAKKGSVWRLLSLTAICSQDVTAPGCNFV